MSDTTIVAIRTLTPADRSNYLWIEIETADGFVGLGETSTSVPALEAHLHNLIAPYLLGEDAAAIERHWWAIYRNFPFPGVGVEARILSAVDIALWDLAGTRLELPLASLLGGSVRDDIRVYNTCSGPDYYKDAEAPGVSRIGTFHPERKYEDYWAFHNTPVELARDLRSSGINAMKIWPFDPAADATGGLTISRRQLNQGLDPIRKIRDALGDDIDIALELHGRWSAAAAIRIAEAVEPYELMWIEDPVNIDDFEGLGSFASRTPTPTASGENLGTFFAYRALLEVPVAVVIAEPVCVGGVTAMRRVAQMAQVGGRSFAAHDCGGPVNLGVGVHLAVHADNAVIQETTRANYLTWYSEVSEGFPRIEGGRTRPLAAPGHGVTLRPEFRQRPDVAVRETRLG